MGCNCGKNKKNQSTETPAQTPATTNNAELIKNTAPPEFRKTDIPEQSLVKKKMSMLQSFATAISSRGIQDNKVNKPIKQLRVLSCFGNMDSGGVMPPCEHLKESTTPGKHFCGGCGCGDKEGTWLVSEGEKYSKLDYPKLQCPLSMPGFTNYKQSPEEEGVDPVTRRWYIENVISYTDMDKISVTTHTIQPKTPDKQ